MGNFNTILAMLGSAVAALLSWSEPAATPGPCQREVAALTASARGEPDWLKREVALALLTEARHAAAHGREAVCRDTLASAREHLHR